MHLKEILPVEVFKQKYNYESLTPIMQQYLDVKALHQDCLLLFRLGDFYELFFDDAELASSLLNLILTARDKKNSENKIPMCGMPFHSVKPYISKLINEGYKIGLCEQTESPLEAKKRGNKALVDRQVQHIFTPGTIIDESLINTSLPNYLVTLVFDFVKHESCICFVDVGARDIGTFCVPLSQCVSELENLMPKEILVKAADFERSGIMSALKDFKDKLVIQPDSFFALTKTQKTIESFYQLKTYKSISESISNIQIQAIGGAIEYILLTQKSHLFLPMPKVINTSDFMLLDSNTQKSLEIVEAGFGGQDNLFKTLNYTASYSGSRLLHRYLLKPLTQIEHINARLKTTNFFFNDLVLTKKVQSCIKSLGDPDRSFTKIALKKANVLDFISIKNALTVGEELRNMFVGYQQNRGLPALLEKILANIPYSLDLKDEIHKSIVPDNILINMQESGFINPSYHPKLKELTQEMNDCVKRQEELAKSYKKLTGIEALKIQNNSVLGSFIEVPIGKSNKMNNSLFIHKQTTINNARFTTIELDELSKSVLNIKIQIAALESIILDKITKQIISHSEDIHNLSLSLAQIDVFCSFALAASDNNYVMPSMNDKKEMKIYSGRHPVIEKALKRSAQSFIPNDCIFDNNVDLMILTGPNMGGKSTFLRQNAIIILMAHVGCFVPAKEARISIVDKVFSRIGAYDNLSKGQSTFMLEMVETAAILSQATNRSFAILDEIGRGTATTDGIAIAYSCLEYLATKIGNKCIFATHYHELTKLAVNLSNVQKYTTKAKEENGVIHLDYLIEKGVANKSYGINVAKIAGLPKEVIKKAEEILEKLEN
jgi:DNA mismatch repair protein MutS